MSRRSDPARAAGDARQERLRAALEAVRGRCDVAARRAADPVDFVHAYELPEDQELVALVAAAIAFGNVKTIRTKLADLLARLGPSPSRAASRPAQLSARLRGWKHRVFLGEDVARLLAGARRVQRRYGSLGSLFAAELDRRRSLREALAAWCDTLRSAARLEGGGPRRGPAHLLPNVRGPSGCKRLLLFLRWMVRRADGVDLGLWPVDPAVLLVPVDVHIHKLGRNLGLTRQRLPSWRAAEDITLGLARFDPSDPTKYDFSLCHLGMVQRCRSRRDPVACEGCGVRPVCVHWENPRRRAPAARAEKISPQT